MDHQTLLLAVAVFLVSSPKDVVIVPNLKNPCMEVFKDAWSSDKPQVRLYDKCIALSIVANMYQINYNVKDLPMKVRKK